MYTVYIIRAAVSEYHLMVIVMFSFSLDMRRDMTHDTTRQFDVGYAQTGAAETCFQLTVLAHVSPAHSISFMAYRLPSRADTKQ